MDRLSFGTRARQQIWRETRASIKGRVTTLTVSLVGILVGYLYVTELHQVSNWQTIKISVMAGITANILWILGVLIYNTVRVPWLLDAESGEQINALEQRALTAEGKLETEAQTKEANKRRHDFFGGLLQTGIDLSCDLSTCHTSGHFVSWDYRLDTWFKEVRQAIAELGFSADVAEFQRAGENAEPVKGIMDTRNNREDRYRMLTEYQKKLEEIVRRRLP